MYESHVWEAHGQATCAHPKVKRRWRNRVWVCPTCGQGWVLVITRHGYPMGTTREWVRWPAVEPGL